MKRRPRQVPKHNVNVVSRCTADQLLAIASSIEDAIHVGAPLYNQGHIEACYRIYAATALDVQKKVDGCAGPKEALLDGVHRADELADWDDKAWAMRDAFDGVLDVIARALDARPAPGAARLPPPPPRGVPVHPASLLDGCSAEDIEKIGGAIGDAIGLGAPLYNAGNLEACYRVYAGAILDLQRQVPASAGPMKALEAGLAEAERRTNYADKAWALRDAFDGILDVISRRLVN